MKTHVANDVYPILTLPSEIVSEILLHTQDQNLKFLTDHSPSRPGSPLFLGHICSKLRAIAISTPLLWTAISIDTTYIADPDSSLCLLDLWLARSCDCPFSIRFTDDSPQPAFGRFFVDRLTPHAHRWEVIILRTLQPVEVPHLRGGMPLLRNLALWTTSAPAGLTMDLQHAPKLTRLSLSHVPPTLLAFRWEQLGNFILREVTGSNVLFVLREARNLFRLTASISLRDDEDASPVPSIMHSHLQTFVLQCSYEPSALLILNALTLPALSWLQLTVTHRPEVVAAAESLCTRSQCEPYNFEFGIIDQVTWEETRYPAVSTRGGGIKLKRLRPPYDSDEEHHSFTESEGSDMDPEEEEETFVEISNEAGADS